MGDVWTCFQSQSPIIRVKQIGTWDTPQTWWKDSQHKIYLLF